ncbi:probable G-protein coupled receptor 156 isoform X2 [Hypanus sabinus]|uniref:probable G-protein coupled receptor 156 isoform X2 n=1 Tax=Hypanus sabinus TaxID=79690 RepID=UPI0028C44D7C|nr:probable G-protein coupled receptor 156 isoform X2 [Hypanus sabinus]
MEKPLNCSAVCSSTHCTVDPGLRTEDGMQLLQQLCKFQIKMMSEAEHVSPVLFGMMGTLLSCGILLALFFLLFTIKFKNNRIVKMSSPNLNIVTIIGSVFTYVSGYMFGLEERAATAEISNKLIFQIRIWALCIGISLIFGPILGKTWRLYKIFTQRIPEKRVIIKDIQLLGMVAGVIGLDILVLLTWGIADPLECIQSLNAEIRAIEKTLSYSATVMKSCASHYTDIWIILISLLKGSLLLYGTYLAGLTSKVSSPPVNQTITIMVGVYLAMFTTGIIIPVTRFLDSWPNLTYGITAGGIFVCTSAINCLIFIPQVRQWKKFDEELNHTPNQMSKYFNSPSKTFRSMYSDEQIYHLLGENNSMKRLLTEKNATIECLQEQVSKVKERLMYLMAPECIDGLGDPTSQSSTACCPLINSEVKCPNIATEDLLNEDSLSEMQKNQDCLSGLQQDSKPVSLQSSLGQIFHDTKISPETVLHSQKDLVVLIDSQDLYEETKNYPEQQANPENITGSFQKSHDASKMKLVNQSKPDDHVKIIQDPKDEMLAFSTVQPSIKAEKPSTEDQVKETKTKFVNSEKLQEILQELNVNAFYSLDRARQILPSRNLEQYGRTMQWLKHHCHNISPYTMRRRRPPFYSARSVHPPYYFQYLSPHYTKYINEESNRDTIKTLSTDHSQFQRTQHKILTDESESSGLSTSWLAKKMQMQPNGYKTPQKVEQRDRYIHSLTSGGECINKSHSGLNKYLSSKEMCIVCEEGSHEIYQYDYSDSESNSSDETLCYYRRPCCETCCEGSCNSSTSETSDSEEYNTFNWSQNHPIVNFKEDLKPTFV